MLLLVSVVFLLNLQNGFSQNLGESCTLTHTRIRGICTKPSKCQSARDDYQNNGISATYCQQPGNLLVCCRPETSTLRPSYANRRTVWTDSDLTQNQNLRVSERKCAEYSKEVTQTVGFIPLSTNPKKQSISSPKCDYTGVELIVGGENATQGEFPHMAAIGWKNLNKIVFQCGGSLISSRFVLSAGHCILDAKMKAPSIVRLGDQNLDPKVQDGAHPIDVEIKNTHKHPEYASPCKYNDIALFELAVDVDFETDIRPACLWTKPDFGIHEKAVATGWGVQDVLTKQTTLELQKVSLSLLQNDYCDPLLEDTQYRHWKGFVPSQMCAGELRGGKDTCQGDSGSPLQVVSRDNKCIFHVVGITSFGHRCAESGHPAVYTRVSSYLDWIESVVWPGEQSVTNNNNKTYNNKNCD